MALWDPQRSSKSNQLSFIDQKLAVAHSSIWNESSFPSLQQNSRFMNEVVAWNWVHTCYCNFSLRNETFQRPSQAHGLQSHAESVLALSPFSLTGFLFLPMQTVAGVQSVSLCIQLESPVLSQDWGQSSRKKHWRRGELEICAILIKHWACTLRHRNSLRHVTNPILPMKKLRLQDAEKFP